MADAQKLIQKEKKERTGKLDLGNCGLTDIPEEVFELTWLEELSFCNEIYNIEKEKWIKTINKGKRNKIEIKTLPKNFKNLNNLKKLYYGSDRFTVNWPLKDISIFAELDYLKILYLAYSQITDITSLKNLTELKVLSLRGSQIKDIEPLKHLTKLNILDLSYNEINDIKTIANLTELDILRLSGNKISDMKPLEHFIDFNKLRFYNNKIDDTKLLDNITKLNSLKWSSLDFKPLRSSDKKLVFLLNSGKSVGESLFNIDISISDNPIEDPPKLIVQEGIDAIINWFEQMEEGTQPLYESKLMILGQPGAGKTTLAKLLQDESYEVKQGKLKSTLGIKIHEGRKFQHRKLDDQKIKAHLWDFGGQDIQKMLHQFFITENCLYILVSDKRAENTNFDYWFQTIKLLGPESNVMVLENSKDIDANTIDFALTKYRELFPKLNITRYEIDLSKIQEKDKEKWEAFKTEIEKQLTDLEIVNREVPQKWTLVRDELEKLGDKKYISKDKFYEICSKEEINLNEEQADLCLFYLKTLGDLVYFDEIGLSNCIFLDHNWLTKGMYYILSDNKIKENNGKFTRDRAYKYWGDEGYSESEKEMLINLLLKDKFDLCYELKDEKDTYITPLLLPDDKPEGWHYTTNLYFRYQYSFFPHGIFSRLIVRLHKKIEGEKRWKSGVRLIDTANNEKVRAEVQKLTEPDSNQKVIDIKISGTKEASKELLNFIRFEISHLHNEFNDLTPNKFVGCNCDTCRQLMENNEKPYFHNYKKLIDKISQNNYFEECDKAGYEKINIGKILNDVVIEDSARNSQDSEFLYELKEMGISLNQIINQNIVSEQEYRNKRNTDIQNKLEKMQKEKIDDQFQSWQRWGKVSLASAIILIVFGLLEFLPAYKWNFAAKVIKGIKSIGSNDPLYTLAIFINIAVLTTPIFFFLKMSFSRLWDDQNKRKVRDEIRKEVEKE